MDKKIKIEKNWKKHLSAQFSMPYMDDLKKFLLSEADKKKVIYPTGTDMFNALNLTPFNTVKVVIFGQDPYHGPGQAHGLCFSVKPEVVIPPSLRNIYKEIKTDLGLEPPSHGHLIHWAQQGVLLLNSVLTVEHHKAASHRGKGWENFTDRIVEVLNEEKEGLVFLLWGRDAQKKGAKIDRKCHLVLETAHPSPLSSYRYFGNRHFSKTNKYLKKIGKDPIDWSVPEIS